MDEAKCVIVLWSKESVKSEWVQNEASEGARRKILVPALIDDVEIPFEFRRVQAARLVDWEGRSPHPEFDTLLEAVCAILGQPLLPQRDSEVPSRDVFDHSKPTGVEPEKGGNMSQTTKVLAAICIVALITIISIGVFLKYRQPKAGSVVAIEGYVHPNCTEFKDEPGDISKGPITKVYVCHSKYIHGLQLYYGGTGGWFFGWSDKQLKSDEVKTTEWTVPPGQQIARVKGQIADYYVSQLQFITDKGADSGQFGGKQGTPFEAVDPKGFPLRTISGLVSLEQNPDLNRVKAITKMNFHFYSKWADR